MFWIVVAIMLLAGVAGGTVNVALSRPDRFEWRSWMWSVIAGVGAALLMPLFLKTVASNLLSGILSESKPEDLLIFGGFSLLAAISSKAFIQTLSDRVLQEARAARREVKETREVVNKVELAAEEATTVARIVQDAADYGLGQRAQLEPSAAAELPVIQEGSDPDDPWTDQFGGRNEAHGRCLEARISPMPGRPDWCSVRLTVRSTDPWGAPLKGRVQFYLHPTFANNKPIVPVTDGKAELNLTTWGAFTAAAIADEGKTLLELDLSEHPQAREPWRSR